MTSVFFLMVFLFICLLRCWFVGLLVDLLVVAFVALLACSFVGLLVCWLSVGRLSHPAIKGPGAEGPKAVGSAAPLPQQGVPERVRLIAKFKPRTLRVSPHTPHWLWPFRPRHFDFWSWASRSAKIGAMLPHLGLCWLILASCWLILAPCCLILTQLGPTWLNLAPT